MSEKLPDNHGAFLMRPCSDSACRRPIANDSTVLRTYLYHAGGHWFDSASGVHYVCWVDGFCISLWHMSWSRDKLVPVTASWRVLRLRMEERPPIWRVAANMLNKQSRTADKGWSSSLGWLSEVLTIPHRKNISCYEILIGFYVFYFERNWNNFHKFWQDLIKCLCWLLFIKPV